MQVSSLMETIPQENWKCETDVEEKKKESAGSNDDKEANLWYLVSISKWDQEWTWSVRHLKWQKVK